MESKENLNIENLEEIDEPRKIGGWLILVAIGVVISPVRIFYLSVSTYPQIFSDGTWEALTTISSEAYSPIWAPFLIIEILVNLIFLVLSLYLAFLFFSKKRTLPLWYGCLAASSAIFILIDAYAVSLVLPELPIFDVDTMKELGRAFFSVLIWTPYLFISNRSKETFIK